MMRLSDKCLQMIVEKKKKWYGSCLGARWTNGSLTWNKSIIHVLWFISCLLLGCKKVNAMCTARYIINISVMFKCSCQRQNERAGAATTTTTRMMRGCKSTLVSVLICFIRELVSENKRYKDTVETQQLLHFHLMKGVFVFETRFI